MYSFRWLAIFILVSLVPAHADDVLYQYEGDVFPDDPAAGWVVADGCDEDIPCTTWLADGHFVVHWPTFADVVHYHYWIAQDPTPPPSTLWVEWNFRSDLPLEAHFWGCDGQLAVDYLGIHDYINMYGDTVINASGNYWVGGLDIDEFHTYRFESLDSAHYTFSVDGQVFVTGLDYGGNNSHFLQFRGQGGCLTNDPVTNEWDFIRYGTIAEGELLVASDPPSGYLDPDEHPDLDRFTVTFDSPNYVYIDDIRVEATGGDPPVVLSTRRLVNGAPETVEIVLDRPLPVGETVTFTFPDPDGPGLLQNVVEYTLIEPIPTVSTWGLIVLTLLLLTAGSLATSRRGRPELQM